MPKRLSLNITRSTLIWAVVALAVAAGIAFSVADYLSWKRLETQKFGQGWADLQSAARPLTWEYTDAELGMKMILPAEWYGQDVGKYFILRKGYGTEADKKVWSEELPGGKQVIRQRLATDVAKTRIVMETVFSQGEWGEWEKTVEAVFKTITPVTVEYSNSDELTVEQDREIQKALDDN